MGRPQYRVTVVGVRFESATRTLAKNMHELPDAQILVFMREERTEAEAGEKVEEYLCDEDLIFEQIFVARYTG